MRIQSIIIALCCLYYINGELQVSCTNSFDTEKFRSVEYTTNSASDCNSRLSEQEKKDGEVCCYQYYSKKSDYKRCISLDKYQFKNFKKYWKQIKLEEEIGELEAEIYKDMPASERGNEKEEDYGEYHIDCYSDYIKITLLNIFLFLF